MQLLSYPKYGNLENYIMCFMIDLCIVGYSIIRHENQLKTGEMIGFLVIFLTLEVSKIIPGGTAKRLDLECKVRKKQSYGLKFLV